ncbi:putative calcium-binding protein CML21 [Porphyridium purpureum]|uniref:Putative calcium-binding protein CML21 n=1 Tax=Porphyridium purpureum TaxID=35688 RepID=A0A5J4YRW1_PORPP|nr:putative calcium-binding protein CML21 [Porphyridium purpureum]|eukprot:POR0695..scf296_7
MAGRHHIHGGLSDGAIVGASVGLFVAGAVFGVVTERKRLWDFSKKYESRLLLAWRKLMNWARGRADDSSLLAELPDTFVGRPKLDVRVALALRQRFVRMRADPTYTPVIKSINTLLMKLPKLRDGFDRCREVFDRIDKDHSGTVDVDELIAGAHQLGYRADDALFREIFEESSYGSSDTLGFGEFLVALALMHVLHPRDELSSDIPTKVKRTFEIMVDAYFYFDVSGDGYLQKDEVLDGMIDPEDRKNDRKGSFKGTIGISEESSSMGSLMKIFHDMDCDNSGVVTFNEFFAAIESWVGLFDDEEEDT